jgi:hypothetical protein
MCSILLKYFSICLLTLIIFNNVICSRDNKKDYIDYEVKNNTKKVQSFNASDDYSYDDIEEDNSEKSFMDRLRLLHEEGKNVTLSKHVNHINDTIKIMKNVFKALFPSNKRTNLEIIEFLTEVDVDLSSECFNAILRIYSALQKYEFWAVKCKFEINSRLETKLNKFFSPLKVRLKNFHYFK